MNRLEVLPCLAERGAEGVLLRARLLALDHRHDAMEALGTVADGNHHVVAFGPVGPGGPPLPAFDHQCGPVAELDLARVRPGGDGELDEPVEDRPDVGPGGIWEDQNAERLDPWRLERAAHPERQPVLHHMIEDGLDLLRRRPIATFRAQDELDHLAREVVEHRAGRRLVQEPIRGRLVPALLMRLEAVRLEVDRQLLGRHEPGPRFGVLVRPRLRDQHRQGQTHPDPDPPAHSPRLATHRLLPREWNQNPWRRDVKTRKTRTRILTPNLFGINTPGDDDRGEIKARSLPRRLGRGNRGRNRALAFGFVRALLMGAPRRKTRETAAATARPRGAHAERALVCARFLEGRPDGLRRRCGE